MKKDKLLSLSPYIFIAPAMLGLLIFKIWPIFPSAWLSFIDYKIINPGASEFVGLANFKKLLFVDRYVWPSMWHTVQYSLLTVIPGLVLSFILALVLSESWFMFSRFFRAILFLPYIVSITITSLIWMYLYNPSFGLLNYMLSWFNIPQQEFLGHPDSAMICVAISVIWKGLGYNITIWTAGIMGISTEYRDAARVDGASYLQELFTIRIPLLKPVIMFLCVLGFIGSFQGFDAIYIMTGGGPIRATEVIVYHLWQSAFKEYNFGYAASISWMIFIILIAISLFQMKILGREADNK
jgi:multiple sugar transport system permease protein